MNSQTVISNTRRWIKNFIIEYNICPFARREYEKNRIRYSISESSDWGICLNQLASELERLDSDPDIETTLLIFPSSLREFDEFLDFLDLAEQVLAKCGYEGSYQLASFHPQYYFADSDADDPANYTNRSPYPMLHIIREDSIELALNHYPDPENIPKRNIELTRQMGLQKLKNLLDQCNQIKTDYEE